MIENTESTQEENVEDEEYCEDCGELLDDCTCDEQDLEEEEDDEP